MGLEEEGVGVFLGGGNVFACFGEKEGVGEEEGEEGG